MANHIRVLGWLHLALGGLGMLGAVVLVLLGGTIGGILRLAGVEAPGAAAIPGLILTVVSTIIGIISLPALLAGWGLLNFRGWARWLTLILCVVNLMNMPFGTALAIYGFWVLLRPETDALFRKQEPVPGHI